MTRPRNLLPCRMPSTAVVLCCVAALSLPARAQFETRATTTVSQGFAVAVGDFNGDGKLDVAVSGGLGLTILLGNGDGTFKQGATYPGVFYSIAVADFNNDGILDLVVAPYADNVTVFLGNGDGTFQTPKTFPTTNPCGFIAVGDLDGDGNMDLAVADHEYISVLLGNGDGTFQAPIDNDSFVDTPGHLALGDFNNDHNLDVAVVGTFGSNADLGILLGNGNGTLQSSMTYSLVYTPYSVAAADFNKDGNLDVAIGGYEAGGTTVLLGKGDGSFGSTVTYLGGGQLVFVDDFNGDGKLDLVSYPSSTVGVAEFLGNGDGTFQPVKVYASGHGDPEAVGDFNGDGKPDLALLGSNPEGVTTMLNTGALTFSLSSPLRFPRQLINTTSGPIPIKLTNNGAGAISFSSIKVSGDFRETDDCIGSISAGASCEIKIVFQPLTPGEHSGLVTILDTASSKPMFAEVSGNATSLKLSPTTVSFGDQKVGTTSSAQQVKVTNESSSTITFKEIDIGGVDYKDFSIQSQTCGTTLTSGANCTVSVAFDPTKTGARNGELVVNVQGGGSPKSVVLTGTGT